ncbi:MAG: ribonuclease Z, partial [Psychroflexus salarius]
ETKSHLIVNLLNFKSDMQLNDLLNFLKLSNHYKSNKKSFVIVAPQIDVHQVPEELAIVPTLNEAFDIIEMENIERDLGF